MRHADDIDHIVINEAKYSYDGVLRKGYSEAGPQLSIESVKGILESIEESKNIYLNKLEKLIKEKN